MVNALGPPEPSRPEWFAAFLADRGTRKPSAHSMKAYRQDFDAIATFVAGRGASDLSRMALGDITTDSMRTAFAQYAETHEAATGPRHDAKRSMTSPIAATNVIGTADQRSKHPSPFM